jgi:hypothetical protein
MKAMDMTCSEAEVAADAAPLFVSGVPQTVLQRDSYRQHIQAILRERNPWKPDVFLVSDGGGLYVVKDYAGKGWIFRVFVGALSIRREVIMYRRLQGIQGIPSRAHSVDRYAIAVTHIPGRNAAQLRPGELTPLFFKQLREIIDRIHDRGLVLCDLRNIKNILLGDDGEPYLIDFSTAFQRGGRWNILKNSIYRIFFQDDLLGIAKLKRERAPHLLTDAERLALSKGVFLQRPAIAVKLTVRKALRWLFGWSKNGKH